MRKAIGLAAALMLLTGALAGPVMAVDDDSLNWDGNAKANFAMFGDRNLPTADGYAIINYVKGKEAYNVSGEVRGMRPDTYTLSVGIAGACVPNVSNTVLLTFTVGADGTASFASTHTKLLAPESPFNIVRIYKSTMLCNTELTAPTTPYTTAYGDTGELVFRDGSRYPSNGAE